MNKEFVPYDIALAMKELGFDEPCIFYYAPDAITISKPTTGVCSSDRYGIIASPLYQQAFRWFFDKYHWTAFNYQMSSGGEMNYGFYVRTINGTDLAHAAQDSVDKAKLECLEKMINLAIKYEKENNNYE